jgi:alcohol dehydrogenase class IV
MFKWNYPTSIRFGIGAIQDLPEACRELGMTKPLLITDRGLAPLPIVAEALDISNKADLPTALFSDVAPNPAGRDVDGGVAAYKDGNHDGVVAMGGGSALDVAKAVALMVGQSRPLWDFEDQADWWTRVNEDGMAPVVAVPTTSGTGSEVGRASVIIDEAAQCKKVIFHPRMLPERVVADPALTVGLPAHLTAAVGMDALSHNLEAYCADWYHPMADGIALEGMRRIDASLARAVHQGDDLHARSEMMIASTMGATAFQKGLGAMHAIAHPIGAIHHTQHGLTNAVLMPYVLVFNRSAIEDKMAHLGRVLGLKKANFDGVLEWVLELREDIGIPHSLADLGVGEGDVAQLAPLAAADPSAGGNPIPLEVPQLAELITRAVRGEIYSHNRSG